MKELRLAWEPENRTPLAAIEDRLRSYRANGIIMLGNGTLLDLTPGEDDEVDARRALNEARFLTDFRTVELKEGGYMVAFHRAVSVFVGADGFAAQRGEVTARLADLCFPGEHFFEPKDAGADSWLVGLYARGKLQRDCYHFHFFKRI
ncbi:hypothetical protein [Variovorax ginsengisoli]|uniref:Uncharacterized protein n=1 Tax=Variovorax ginsengisoli TaxID=363844 RepID=A0ABT9SF04_9BURK|nr:hypothetical protein [Variovorax ginsengisoli]MDP9902948.1 hypothetical protein [Variovorax ginsengisoli]